MAECNRHSVDDFSAVTTESWRTMRVMAEMVQAIDTLNNINVGLVPIFGSARSTRESQEYRDAETLAGVLANAGYGIVTGGGSGVMEAANKGAIEAGGESVGLHIELPNDEIFNQYVKTRCTFRYFFLRKLMFVKYAIGYVVMPGGMGTIDEWAEAFVLAQTGRSKRRPLIMYNSSYWKGLLTWIQDSMIPAGYLDNVEIEQIVNLCDSPDEVLQVLERAGNCE